MQNNKINLNKNIIKDLIDSTVKSTPGIREWEIISIEQSGTNDEILHMHMSINVSEELNQKTNVIDEFEEFLKEKLNSILDINKNNIVLKIELI